MQHASKTVTGLEHFIAHPQIAKDWGRCGLLCNQASVTSHFVHAIPALRAVLGSRLTALFNPQHGLQATLQDNMIESGHETHLPTGLPIFSLYSETRQPTAAMLSHIDTLIIDIQIVGCRVYTYKASIAECLRAAKKFGKRVVILDRPNPVGGELVEGRVLEPAMRSFVGPAEIPMRHGLSAGEAAQFFNQEIGADLEIVSLSGWNPHKTWHATGLPWVITSPNLPTLDPVMVYPGTVIFEGTNASEGRGTGLPFQFIGAPYVKNEEQFVQHVLSLAAAGGERSLASGAVHLRPTQFMPTSGKGKDMPCRGLQIHVLKPDDVCSYGLALCILVGLMEAGGAAFAWKQPPYEYVHDTLPMKIILGAEDFETHLRKFSVADSYWHEGCAGYIKKVEPFLIYPRTMRVA